MEDDFAHHRRDGVARRNVMVGGVIVIGIWIRIDRDRIRAPGVLGGAGQGRTRRARGHVHRHLGV